MRFLFILFLCVSCSIPIISDRGIYAEGPQEFISGIESWNQNARLKISFENPKPGYILLMRAEGTQSKIYFKEWWLIVAEGYGDDLKSIGSDLSLIIANQ